MASLGQISGKGDDGIVYVYGHQLGDDTPKTISEAVEKALSSDGDSGNEEEAAPLKGKTVVGSPHDSGTTTPIKPESSALQYRTRLIKSGFSKKRALTAALVMVAVLGIVGAGLGLTHIVSLGALEAAAPLAGLGTVATILIAGNSKKDRKVHERSDNFGHTWVEGKAEIGSEDNSYGGL